MSMAGIREIGRGLVVTTIASVGGAMLGTLALGGNPFAGLTFFPFTLFGSFVILLPAYLWFAGSRHPSRLKAYGAVIAAGLLGGLATMAIILGNPGPYGRWFRIETFEFCGLGMTFGLASAICWIAAHHITGGMHPPHKPRSLY